MSFSLNPVCFRKPPNFFVISLNLSSSHSTVSILFTATHSCETPSKDTFPISGFWNRRGQDASWAWHWTQHFMIATDKLLFPAAYHHKIWALCSLQCVWKLRCDKNYCVSSKTSQKKLSGGRTHQCLLVQQQRNNELPGFSLPRDLMSIACSLVCPPASNPVSNSPRVELTTRIATSAWAAPANQKQMLSFCDRTARRMFRKVSIPYMSSRASYSSELPEPTWNHVWNKVLVARSIQ